MKLIIVNDRLEKKIQELEEEKIENEFNNRLANNR